MSRDFWLEIYFYKWYLSTEGRDPVPRSTRVLTPTLCDVLQCYASVFHDASPYPTCNSPLPIFIKNFQDLAYEVPVLFSFFLLLSPPLACAVPPVTNWPICRPPLRDRQTCSWIQVSPTNYWLWNACRVSYIHCILHVEGVDCEILHADRVVGAVNIDRLRICDTVQSDKCTRTFQGDLPMLLRYLSRDGCRFVWNISTCLPDQTESHTRGRFVSSAMSRLTVGPWPPLCMKYSVTVCFRSAV